MTAIGHDSLKTRRSLKAGGSDYDYYSIEAAEQALGTDFSRLPFSMKVLLENMLRFEDGRSVTQDDIKAFGAWLAGGRSDQEIAFRPGRVLLQDFTGVPAVVDLAAMRDALKELGGDPQKINPLTPVDLVVDHSVSIDSFGSDDSFEKNVELEFERNMERYEFLRWGQSAMTNFRVVLHLSRKEYDLLRLLVRHVGQVLTHQQILREIWGAAHTDDIHYLRVLVGSLRQKLGDDPARPHYIATEQGVGYRLLEV